MSEPFIGQLMLVGFSFAPVGWAFCDGSILSISQYDALFTLIGTTFGGDGQTTFALPDLRGRTPIGQGQSPGASSYTMGERGGTETVTINMQQFPAHTHAFLATTDSGGVNSAAGAALGSGQTIYKDSPGLINAMNTAMLSPSSGGSQPHENLQPYLTCNWIIAMEGIFPSQG
jgi:microcystin-dependent protein